SLKAIVADGDYNRSRRSNHKDRKIYCAHGVRWPNAPRRSLESQPLFELIAAGAADVELGAILEAHGVVAAGAMQERVDAVEPHDRRAMNAKEDVRIELLLERLHSLAHGVRFVGNVKFRVW